MATTLGFTNTVTTNDLILVGVLSYYCRTDVNPKSSHISFQVKAPFSLKALAPENCRFPPTANPRHHFPSCRLSNPLRLLGIGVRPASVGIWPLETRTRRPRCRLDRVSTLRALSGAAKQRGPPNKTVEAQKLVIHHIAN